MGASPSAIFQEIEESCHDLNCPIQKKNRENLIDQVLEYFDKDHSGTLTDFEIVNLIEVLSNYIVQKLQHNNKKVIRRNLVATWIYDNLDINNDGRITREEMRSQLGKLLDIVNKKVD